MNWQHHVRNFMCCDTTALPGQMDEIIRFWYEDSWTPCWNTLLQLNHPRSPTHP
jgi:hypothetical protein